MQPSHHFKYTTLASNDDAIDNGEPESASRSLMVGSPTGKRPGRSRKVEILSRLRQTKPLRPPPHTREGHVRLPNETYVYLLTAFVSLGALLFGYDQGVMGVIVADARWKDLMRPKNSCMLPL